MKGYKTSDNRLANLFKSAREKWKEKALELEVTVREKEEELEELKKKIFNYKINQK